MLTRHRDFDRLRQRHPGLAAPPACRVRAQSTFPLEADPNATGTTEERPGRAGCPLCRHQAVARKTRFFGAIPSFRPAFESDQEGSAVHRPIASDKAGARAPYLGVALGLAGSA